jgi:hypothetical protein
LFLGEVVFCMLGFTVRWFFEVLQNPEELWVCNKQVRSEGRYSFSLSLSVIFVRMWLFQCVCVL